MRAWAGLDVGGQAAKGVAIDESGTVLARVRRPTGLDTDLDRLVTIVRAVLEELGRTVSLELRIGVGVAGVFGHAGVLRGSPNLPRLAGLAIGPVLGERLGRPAVIENDANCAAVGEGMGGAADRCATYFMVTVGSGIGSGLILDGDLYRGVTGYGCELGHTVIERGGRLCGCGNRGCLEAYVSESAAREYVREAGGPLEQEVGRAVRQRDHGFAQALFALADAGEATAVRIADGMTGALGTGLASAINLIDVPTVIVGGGIAPAILTRRRLLVDALGAALFARSASEVNILAATRGGDAGAVGAARIAMRSH